MAEIPVTPFEQAAVDAKNAFGGNALDQTYWCLVHHTRPAHPPLVELFRGRGQAA